MTWQEAYAIGVRRNVIGLARKRQHRYGWKPTPEQARHVNGMGAVAEWRVSVVTGRKWLSMGDEPDRPEDGDVEGPLHVRWTWRTDGCLVVHPGEPDKPFVLVAGTTHPLRVVGWFPGGLAQDPRWWRTNVRTPAFFVRQDAPLRKIADLPPVEKTHDAV